MRIAVPDLFGFDRSRRTAEEHSARRAAKGPDTARSPKEVNRDTVTLGGRKAGWVTDGIALAQFVGSGYLYDQAGKAAARLRERIPALSDAPVVKLEDPLLVTLGWTTKPEKFDAFVAHILKAEENGDRAVYLKEGQAYTDKDCTDPTELKASDKLFISVYDDVLSPPDETAPQIAQSLSQIKELHGEKVDILGYSLGGVAVRKMLDEKLQTADQVALLGVASHGTRFAELSRYIIHRDIKFALDLGNLSPAHLPAMEWMVPDSPVLKDMNDNVDRQLGQVNEMVSIGSDGLRTIKDGWGRHEGGDGIVPKSSTVVEGIPSTFIYGRGNKQHGQMPSDTDAFVALKEAFGWQEAELSLPNANS